MTNQKSDRYIVHVDMDAFFAAVEQRDDPSLKGKPVVIGADPKGGRGRGVVSTCSYEARKFGIRSAMPISQAYKRCSHAVFLRGNIKKYSRVSEQIHDIFNEFTPDVEGISIDEAFLDITGSAHLFGGPVETCKRIKKRILESTGLTASIGLAPTKMAAKIASDLQKPDGFVIVEKDGIREFLKMLDIGKIWGLGPKSKEIFNKRGVTTIGRLAAMDLQKVQDMFGKNGIDFWHLANGIDERRVETGAETKSISNELTFDEDTDDEQTIQSTLSALSEQVSGRLRRGGFKACTISLKIRLEGFKTYTRDMTISIPTNFTDEIYTGIKALYVKFNRQNVKVRLVGVKAGKLSDASIQEDLFGSDQNARKEKIHTAVDTIRDRFGRFSITRASSK